MMHKISSKLTLTETYWWKQWNNGAEPFVTKPSMVRHHYKPERHMRKWVSIFKVKVTVTEFRFIQSNMTISIICSELLIFWGDQFSLTVHVECLVKRSQWRFWTSVNVCPVNISDQSNLVWWCIIISQSIIQKYHFAMPQSFLLDLQKN